MRSDGMSNDGTYPNALLWYLRKERWTKRMEERRQRRQELHGLQREAVQPEAHGGSACRHGYSGGFCNLCPKYVVDLKEDEGGRQ